MFTRISLVAAAAALSAACSPITAAKSSADQHNAPVVRSYEPQSTSTVDRSAASIDRAAVDRLTVDRTQSGGAIGFASISSDIDVPQTAPTPRSCTKCQ